MGTGCYRIKMAEDTDQNNWQVDMEVNLFHAMRGHKPVGVNRFFQMVFIHEKLNSSLSKKIASQQIWTQLTKMYDLQALNESEIIPFPNKKTDFSLPEGDFGDLMSKDYPRMSKNALGPATDSAKQELAPPTPKQGGKGGNQSGSASTLGAGSLNTNTPEASPKRKRTRNTQSTPSSANSTPDAPPTKRRR